MADSLLLESGLQGGDAQEEINPLNFESVRATWISKQLKLREAAFTKTYDISVLHATWNVNMAKATSEIWPIFAGCAQPPDIVSFGMQELDMTAESLLRGETARAGPWIDHTLNQLNYAAAAIRERNRAQSMLIPNNSNPSTTSSSSGEASSDINAQQPQPQSQSPQQSPQQYVTPEVEPVYELLQAKQMVGILLSVYVLKKHRPHISEVMTSIVTTGILGVMGNKGGIATRFRFHDSTFCILNAHFNAHQTNVARRNQDYRDICTVIFNVGEGPMTIFDHDNIFWIGDLNYRIDLPDEVVREKIKQSQWDYLFQYDQLNIHMKRGNVFTGWQEAPINFAPTYKYVCGSSEYDVEKGRIPAWCDRILWKSSDKIKNLTYRRHELLQSDHRPVSALFTVPIKSIVKEQRQIVLHELMQELDRKENDTIPDASISTTDCDFGQVRFGVPVTRTVVLENIGKVVCRWKFIPKLSDTKPYKDWLHIQPNMGMLMPGDKVTIALTVVIAESVSSQFNIGDEKIEDILILHLMRGKDHFLSITGKYLYSAFGNRLDNLVRMVTPARLRNPLPESEKAKWLRIPKELWRLVDWLYRNALEIEDLFLESGDSFEMDQIREALDTGAEIPKVYPHSVSETLLRLLESLEIPVIPFTFYRNVLEVQSAAMAKQLVSKLPDIHYNTFFYLISFLREVLTRKDKNKLTAEKLAVVFSNVLVRPPKGVKQSEQAHKQQAACVELFLHNDEVTLSMPIPTKPSSSQSSPAPGSNTQATPTASPNPGSTPKLGSARIATASTPPLPTQQPSTSSSLSGHSASVSSSVPSNSKSPIGWRSSTPTN